MSDAVLRPPRTIQDDARLHRLALVLALGFALAGSAFLGKGLYIHAKAWAAQLLIHRAWSATLQGQADARPWPWADTVPRARLVVPRLGVDQIVLAGASGFWMIHRAQMWGRFTDPQFWWMHAMVGLWAIFFAMLFLAEPLFLHWRMRNSPDPGRDFRRMERLHRILLLLAVVTVLGAAAGSHGLF